ncbi:MAG: fluoride efflux transporter CrcB [Pseudomonadota bacterium]|nr:fluoride efflux transporter CrcB [Sphingomonas sp.]MDQ3479591.1 fluoride efflux transporter CrcB [Pseudomonadota bacterium]
MLYLIVFAGAGIGGALRHGVNEAAWKLGAASSAATLFVNIAGSLAMGVLAGYFASRLDASQHVRLFLTTGILGGFTTFSAFSLDTALLIQRHSYWTAAGYAAASVLCSVGALFAGLALYRAAAQLP